MATNGDATVDALTLMRTSISQSTLPIPTTSAEDAISNTDVVPLEQATHLQFNTQSAATGALHSTLPLTTPTRFISQRASAALDLLSVYFCWLNKDTNVSEYISATQALNELRTKNGLSNVTNLVFAEKLDLVNWLTDEGGESDFIRALDDNKVTRGLAGAAADLVRGNGDVVMGEAGLEDGAMGGRREEERMKEIYAAERSLGDRNTVLHGVKATDFSHIKKHSEIWLSKRTAARPNGPTPAMPLSATPALRPNSKPTSNRRPEPIILLSPSASSLLRLSNIKSFLTDGVFQPPSSDSSSIANMIQLNRLLPTIDATRPLRFILVEGPENFKPDYWNRVVAVFTTGQAWQFKGYKWQAPPELFSHALGVYVGNRGEGTPETVKGWGRGVLSVGVDKWREGQVAQQRWRDREVVEEIWSALEMSMRSKGWGKDIR